MTIYLDYIFIENLLIDYILLKETSYIARKDITSKQALLSAIIASSYVVIMMYLKLEELNYLICKILLAIVIIYTCFKPKKINEYIKLLALFFLISVINVGTLIVIQNLINLQNISSILKLIAYTTSLILSKCFMKHMWKIYKQNIKEQDLIYEVKIKLGERTYEYKAFLDTGNSVFSYVHNVPVIFAEILDDEMLKIINKKEFFEIKTVTLSNQSKKKAYIFDKVEIKYKEKKWHVKAAIVFERTKLSKDKSYNMLLNYILYVQSLGGIKI